MNDFVKLMVGGISNSKIQGVSSIWDFLILLLGSMNMGSNIVTIHGDLSNGILMKKDRHRISYYKKQLVLMDIIRKVEGKKFMINPMVAHCINTKYNAGDFLKLERTWDSLKED